MPGHVVPAKAFNLSVGVASNASGIALPGAVTGWIQTLAEDFNSSFSAGGVDASGNFPAPYTSEANAYPDGTFDTSHGANSTNSIYKPSTNLSCTSSRLITLCNVVAGQARSSTYVITAGASYGQLYGRFSVCYRIPSRFHGFKTAFLLWPNSGNWPTDSEIDWPEGSFNTGDIFGANFLHQGGAATDFDHHRYGSVPTADGAWHVATIEWDTGWVRALWDGVTVGTSYDRMPNTSMYWAIQTETDGDGYPSSYPISTDTGTLEVDWVAAWTPNSPTVPGAGAAPSNTVALTEPFTGTTGAAWSATNWTSTTTTTGSSSSIQTNKGRFVTGVIGGYGDSVYRNSNTALPADHIILATVNILNTAESYPYICFRDDGTGTTGWRLYFYVATSQIILDDNHGLNQVFTVNWTTFTTSTSIKVEILTQSSVSSFRFWNAAGSRPTNPSAQTNVTGFTGTHCGLGILGGNAVSSVSVDFDDFSIASVP